MNVSQDRFSVSPSEQRGIDLFQEYLWHNSEVCNHCFTRVREIDEETIRIGKNRQKSVQWEYHERTEHSENEFNSFAEGSERRFGTTFCLECGSDCSADHHQLSLEELKPIARNIYLYTTDHTPLDLDAKAFGREIRDLKNRRDTQGKETQILAVAFARSLKSIRSASTSQYTATGDAEGRVHSEG
jgi:hypothetical protein